MVENRPEFSIITASFNSGTKLSQTYASIVNQQVDYEYIIMDGASTDGSREIGQRLAADDKRIRFFSEPDKGVYDAMNKSAAVATGRYLYFIGAGDALLPGSLHQVAKFLPKDLNSLVYGDCIMDGKRYRGKFRKRDFASLNICHQGIFYGRDVFKICGNYDCRYQRLADWEFNMRCFGNRKIRTAYMPMVVASFEPGGISSQIRDAAFRADHRMLIRRYFGMFTSLQVALQSAYRSSRGNIAGIARRIRKSSGRLT